MSREQFINNLKGIKHDDLAKDSLRLVILEQHDEIEGLEAKLRESLNLCSEIIDDGYFEGSRGLDFITTLKLLEGELK